jgi:hypothetical protein
MFLCIGRRLIPAVMPLMAPLVLCSAMAAQSPSAQKVIVLPPQVSVDRLSAGSKSRDKGSAPFEPVLAQAAESHLQSQGYTLLDAANLSDPSLAGPVAQLQPLVSRLARGALSDETQPSLSRLAALPGDYLVFAQVMKVKEGPGASWNSFTGQITTAISSTVLQAALISPRTGRVLWKNEEMERKIFRPEDAHFARLLESLYTSLGK